MHAIVGNSIIRITEYRSNFQNNSSTEAKMTLIVVDFDTVDLGQFMTKLRSSKELGEGKVDKMLY